MKPRVVDKDRGWRAMLKAVDLAAGQSYAKVGVLADDAKGGLHAIDPDTGKAAALTVAEIAAVQEFGTEDRHVQERPFLRPTFDKQREAMIDMSRRGLVGILDGKLTVGQVLNMLGAFLAAETKKTITTGAGVPPPNAPSTALRKAMRGRTKRFFRREARTLGDALAQVGAIASVRTLVDTGRLVGAITWTVVFGSFSQGVGGVSGSPVSSERGVR